MPTNEANIKINGTKCPKMVSLHTNVLDMDVNAAVNQFNYACCVICFENGLKEFIMILFSQLTKLMTAETEILIVLVKKIFNISPNKS